MNHPRRPMQSPIKPYRGKVEPVGDPNDPTRKALERIERARKKAARHALETGEPFVDPHPLGPRRQRED